MLTIALALVPVVAFLAALWLMDAFRLVSRATLARSIGCGAGVAVISLWLNAWLQHTFSIPSTPLQRYVAPVVEEIAKALVVVGLISTASVGFLVDAALQGFAIGAGFALVENLWYLREIPDGSIALWAVRGFGTALLHGAVTAIIAIVAKTIADRWPDRAAFGVLPGLAAAIAIHSGFNHRVLPPLAETLVLLVALPLLVVVVFERSERATREWIGAGLDLDIALIDLLNSPEFSLTRFGSYLHELRTRMPGRLVADMYCLLRLELELSAQAKGMLLARESGLELPADDELEATLAERRSLEASIGKTGLLALDPLRITSRRDRWHRQLLQARRPSVRPRG
jgi:RsiW-degrading membrane proteinase PrsW (M82 family)